MLIPLLALAQAATTPAPDYRDPAAWLCRPDRADACVTLPATIVEPDGTTRPEPVAQIVPPTVDRFYVYPTVSRDPGINSDLLPGPEEQRVVAAQFARFREVCRTFAPMYRQMTLTALRQAMAGNLPRQGAEVANGDVRAAFRDYLAHDNGGRPFALIGHSQGALMLKQLVTDEIDGKPLADRMLSAMLIGTNVEVAEGQDVGGDFRSVPLCRMPGQTGCVVSYVSFRADQPPPPGGRFGRAAAPGRQVACVNPAAPAGGQAPAQAVLPTAGFGEAAAPQPDWVRGGANIATPFVRVPGLLSAACRTIDGASYLAITTNADPADPRTDAIGGDVMAGGAVLTDWGLHLLDMSVMQGDLVVLVAEQARTMTGRGMEGARAGR